MLAYKIRPSSIHLDDVLEEDT